MDPHAPPRQGLSAKGLSGLAQLPADAFRREDENDDGDFYLPERLVTHIDDDAIAALTEYYRSILSPGADVLDLMSSWVSHLPEDLPLGEVVGHGMNRAELDANPRLTQALVQDLNSEPSLPLADDSFDAALCCVSVQYLVDPVAMFTEVRRVLRPGRPVVISISNRCFPTKAVRIWLGLDMQSRAGLVGLYLEAAGFGEIGGRVLTNGMHGDPLIVVSGTA